MHLFLYKGTTSWLLVDELSDEHEMSTHYANTRHKE